MVRNTAREIAAHLSYELSFTDKTVDELLKERLTPEAFAELAEEDPLYADAPNAKQAAYITRLVKGVRTFPTAPPSMRRWRLPKSTKRRRRPNLSTAFWAALCGRRSPSNPAEPAERTRRRPQAALPFVLFVMRRRIHGAEKPGR